MIQNASFKTHHSKRIIQNASFILKLVDCQKIRLYDSKNMFYNIFFLRLRMNNNRTFTLKFK